MITKHPKPTKHQTELSNAHQARFALEAEIANLKAKLKSYPTKAETIKETMRTMISLSKSHREIMDSLARSISDLSHIHE